MGGIINVKKVFEFFKNILMMIVYPSRILELFKVKNLDRNYNKVLGNEQVVKVLALVIALIIVVTTRYTPDAAPTVHQETLEDVPVTILIDEDYTYFGTIPTHVDVILSGDRTLIEVFTHSSGSITAHIDLRGLEPKVYENVLIQIRGETGQITATPSTSTIAEIEIVRIETMDFPIRIDDVLPIDLPEINIRYAMEKVVTPNYVTVRGPQEFLDEIAAIRVTFDASSLTEEELTTGRLTFQGIVVAHDSTAHPVTGVDIEPSVVDVQLVIFENLRTIDIEVNSQQPLNLPKGYRIESMTTNITEIQVWGDFSEMDGAIVLPRINFTNLDEDGRKTVQIPLPNDVFSEINEVEITVEYTPPSTRDEDED
jgi:YbbR domain-containing protein